MFKRQETKLELYELIGERKNSLHFTSRTTRGLRYSSRLFSKEVTSPKNSKLLPLVNEGNCFDLCDVYKQKRKQNYIVYTFPDLTLN